MSPSFKAGPSLSALNDFTTEPHTRLATIGNTEYDFVMENSNVSKISLSNEINPISPKSVLRPFR